MLKRALSFIVACTSLCSGPQIAHSGFIRASGEIISPNASPPPSGFQAGDQIYITFELNSSFTYNDLTLVQNNHYSINGGISTPSLFQSFDIGTYEKPITQGEPIKDFQSFYGAGQKQGINARNFETEILVNVTGENSTPNLAFRYSVFDDGQNGQMQVYSGNDPWNREWPMDDLVFQRTIDSPAFYVVDARVTLDQTLANSDNTFTLDPLSAPLDAAKLTFHPTVTRGFENGVTIELLILPVSLNDQLPGTPQSLHFNVEQIELVRTVPEPSSLLLLAPLALAGGYLNRRRLTKKQSLLEKQAEVFSLEVE